MPQTYTVKSVKVGDQWSNAYGSFQSIALALDGVGEPVSINRKLNEDGTYKEVTEGEELFGDLELKKGPSGRDYYKFKAVKPEFKSGGGGGRAPSDPRTMYTAYAKDVWVAMCAEGQVDNEAYLQALDQIKSGGERLMNGE